MTYAERVKKDYTKEFPLGKSITPEEITDALEAHGSALAALIANGGLLYRTGSEGLKQLMFACIEQGIAEAQGLMSSEGTLQ